MTDRNSAEAFAIGRILRGAVLALAVAGLAGCDTVSDMFSSDDKTVPVSYLHLTPPTIHFSCFPVVPVSPSKKYMHT